ncbi:phosphoribosyltransferase family protein [Patescibacteria group bacterium]
MNRLSPSVIRAIFENAKAIIPKDHFVYKSGKHGPAYVNKDAIYPDTNNVARLCGEIAVRTHDLAVDVVVAPAIGGVILSQWTAQQLYTIYNRPVFKVEPDFFDVKHVFSVYAEKDPANEDVMVIKRGYNKFLPGKNVLVVEDILNTGGSAAKTVQAVRDCSGKVVAVAALCNRGGVTAEDLGGDLKLFSLMDVQMDMYEADECPLCKEGVPINAELGHGREFLAALEKQNKT